MPKALFFHVDEKPDGLKKEKQNDSGNAPRKYT